MQGCSVLFLGGISMYMLFALGCCLEVDFFWFWIVFRCKRCL